MKRLLLVLAMMFVGGSAMAQSNQILLDFKDNVTVEQIQAFDNKYHVVTHANSEYSAVDKFQVTEFMPDVLINPLINLMASDPLLENIEPMAIYSIPENEAVEVPVDLGVIQGNFPNDPKYKYQWHMDQIHMQEAWKVNQGNGAIVAVIDTGVAYENYKDPKTGQQFIQVEDLKGTCFVPGYDFVNKDSHPNDDHAHGTHVAGTIAQATNNGVGVTGIAYQACIMPLKVLSAQGGGTTDDIAESIRWAADHGANVINMSLGGPFPSGVMKDACDYARSKGVTIIAAAGNNGWRKVGYPAAYEGVVAVSATNLDDKLAFYSNYGDDIDISAPGGDAREDKNKDGVPDGVVQNTIKVGDPTKADYFPFMGTSMASPHVAGVAALIVSMGIKNPAEVEKVLFESADRKPAENDGVPRGTKWDEKYGFGRLDARAAVAKAKLLAGSDSLLSWETPLKAEQSFVNTLSAVVALGGSNRGNVPSADWFILNTEDPFSLVLSGLIGLLLLGWASARLVSKDNLKTSDSWLHSTAAALGATFGSFGLMLLTPSLGLLGYAAIIPVALLSIFGGTRFYSLFAGMCFGVVANLYFAGVCGTDFILPGTMFDYAWLTLSAATCLFLGYFSLARK